MKLHLLAGLLLAAPAAALAHITPLTATSSGVGLNTWDYTMGWVAPAAFGNPWLSAAPRGRPPAPDVAVFITLQDFAGYVDGSCSGPAGWVCEATPARGIGATDLRWSYAGGLKFLGARGDIALGRFSAQSVHAGSAPLTWWSDQQPGSVIDTAGVAARNGQTLGPQALRAEVPLPGSLALAGLGLGLLAWTRRGTRPASDAG